MFNQRHVDKRIEGNQFCHCGTLSVILFVKKQIVYITLQQFTKTVSQNAKDLFFIDKFPTIFM